MQEAYMRGTIRMSNIKTYLLPGAILLSTIIAVYAFRTEYLVAPNYLLKANRLTGSMERCTVYNGEWECR